MKVAGRALSRCAATNLLAALALGLAWSEGGAQTQACEDKARPYKWTPNEQWAWARICSGQAANFLERKESERTISGTFLRDILVSNELSTAVPQRGIAINGAEFTGPAMLQNMVFPKSVSITSSTLTLLRLTEARLRLLNLSGSKAINVDLIGARIEESLFLQGLEVKDALTLSHSSIGYQLRLDGATVGKALKADSIRVGADALLSKLTAKEVDLGHASVRGQIALEGATVAGKLNLNTVSVGDGLFMDGGSFSTVDMESATVGNSVYLRRSSDETNVLDLRNAKIGTDLQLTGSRIRNLVAANASIGADLILERSVISGQVDLQNASVGHHVLFQGAKTAPTANPAPAKKPAKVHASLPAPDVMRLHYMTIGGTLDLSDSELRSIDLTGSKVEKGIRLGSSRQRPPVWLPDSRLNLRNVSAASIQDMGEDCEGKPAAGCRPDAWPKRLDLNGFSFRQFGAVDVDPKSELPARSAEWWVGWLCRQEHFSPSPYHNVARVLREHGHPDKADKVLYAAKNRELSLADFGDSVLLLSQKVLIGYGYRLWLAWFWIAGFIGAGVLVLKLSGEGRRHGLPYGVAYSIDMLLPIIELREKHYKMDLQGWARYYFYFHKMMGYVLASFLAAGLAGLTK
jgi:uncharacterized protein YjbI with pentapeptide repeats